MGDKRLRTTWNCPRFGAKWQSRAVGPDASLKPTE
jgi:hypothetical protein